MIVIEYGILIIYLLVLFLSVALDKTVRFQV